jgi:two-component system cell cycle response regulator
VSRQHHNIPALQRAKQDAADLLPASEQEDRNGDGAHLQALTDQLEHELERSRRGSRRLSVVIGALLGSTPADRGALSVVTTVMAGEKRRIDSAGLIAGDRFVLILPDTAEQGALTLAERLGCVLTEALGSEGYAARPSFGIASFPRHGRHGGALLKAAERALAVAASLGGDPSLARAADAPSAIVSASRSDGADQHLEILLALAETADVRDHGGGPGHSQTVGRYAEQMARELGLPDAARERVRLAATLHDIGKVAVPEWVLEKPGPLDPEEWRIVRGHAEAGAQMIEGPGLEDVRRWIQAHHERPDGRGYPHGLGAGQIPLEARVIAVADAYEAMTSDRPYRAALSHPAAQAELVECSGTQFDQRVVHAFLRLLEREGLRTRDRSPVEG